MSSIVLYNPSGIVANQVTSFLSSVNTPDYDTESNKVVNPDLSAVGAIPQKFWKVSGSSVVEMSAGEKSTIDAALLPVAKATKKIALTQAMEVFLLGVGYSADIRQNLLTMYSNALRYRPNRIGYLQPFIDWMHTVDTELGTKIANVDAQTTLEGVEAIVIDTSGLIATVPNKTLKGSLDTVDATDIANFLDVNAVITDPDTGVKGPFYIMQELEHRKDLYNDTDNPIYKAGHTPILGVNGILQDHANRVLNLELIHGKAGWHAQSIKEASYKRPTDLLIYYGYPNSFNSGTNGWDNEKVARDMAKYGMIILGNGVQDPGHGDYANTQVIIPRVKQYNPNCLIFGYVSANQTLGAFQTKTDQWDALQVHGIFLDEAGYDFGKTRTEFNDRVNYVHTKTYTSIAFVNAWNTDHVLGTADDVSYPNSTYNPELTASVLTTDDWILLESFPINTTAYSGNAGYESKSDWLVRGVKAQNLRYTYNVNFAACGIINNANAAGQNIFNFLFTSTLMFSLEAVGSSDTDYGSGATVTYWVRPDIKDMGVVWGLSPSVQNDTGDADVYYKYTETARMLLDFSTAAQLSSITKW